MDKKLSGEHKSFSGRFLYTMAKRLDGISQGGTTGGWIQRAHKFYGICENDFHPDDTKLPREIYETQNIPIKAFLNAYTNRTSYYQRLYSIDDCANAIKEMFGVKLCFDIFEEIKNAPGGYVQLPKIGEKQIGSHSVLALGYFVDKTDNQKYFKFVNSWGAEWGDHGCGYLPVSYFEEGLVSEAWSNNMFKKPISIQRFSLEIRKNAYEIEISEFSSLRYDNQYPVLVFDVYFKNMLIGSMQTVQHDANSVEIEELYVLPEYQNKDIGSELLSTIELLAKENGFLKIVGWIAAQDLIPQRRTTVIKFFEKNRFSMIEDNSQFRDSVYRIEKEL